MLGLFGCDADSIAKGRRQYGRLVLGFQRAHMEANSTYRNRLRCLRRFQGEVRGQARAMPIHGRALASMKTECGIDLAGGGEIIRQATFCMAREGDERGHRNPIKSQGKVVIVSSLRSKAASEAKRPALNGCVAVEVENIQVVLAEAARGQAQGLALGRVIAMKVLQIGLGGEVQARGRAIELELQIQAAAPSLVVSQGQAGKLP